VNREHPSGWEKPIGKGRKTSAKEGAGDNFSLRMILEIPKIGTQKSEKRLALIAQPLKRYN